MLSRIKFAFPCVVLAGFLFAVPGVHSQAQAQEALPSAVETQILALINDAVTSGDTTALEEGLSALVTANPDLAKALADFASGKVPSEMPAGLPEDFAETLVVAIATAIVGGAPEAAGDVTAAIEANQPQFADAIESGVEFALLAAGFETAAGGPPGRGNRQAPNPNAAGAAFENPSTQTASPTG